MNCPSRDPAGRPGARRSPVHISALVWSKNRSGREDAERATLGEIAHRLGRNALAEVAATRRVKARGASLSRGLSFYQILIGYAADDLPFVVASRLGLKERQVSPLKLSASVHVFAQVIDRITLLPSPNATLLGNYILHRPLIEKQISINLLAA